jgi:hypothetical protein
MAVVAGQAERLPIGAAPEKALIALMWLDMINALCGRTASANGVVPKIFGAGFLPFMVIAAGAGARTLLIEAGFSLAVLLGLACAAEAVSNDLAA